MRGEYLKKLRFERFGSHKFGEYDREQDIAETKALLEERGFSVSEGLVIHTSDVRSALARLEMCDNECPGIRGCKYQGYKPMFREMNGILYANVVAECEKRQEMLRERAAMKYAESLESLSKRFRDKTFASFETSGRSQSVIALFNAAKRASRDRSSIVMSGTVGTGKTHLAAAIAIEALQADRSVIFRCAPDLLRSLKSFGTDGEYDDILDSCCQCSLLVLDDIGTAKMTDWGAEQMYTIVNARYNEERQIVITTNISTPMQLAEYLDPLGERIISRLCEMSKWHYAKDRDWRTL